MINNIIIFGTGNIAEVAYYYLKNDTNLNIVGFTLEKDFIKRIALIEDLLRSVVKTDPERNEKI